MDTKSIVKTVRSTLALRAKANVLDASKMADESSFNKCDDNLRTESTVE